MRDPALRTVVAEDGTAVIGVLLAITGMVLHMVTSQVVGEACASLAIGALLVGVAHWLGRDARDQLSIAHTVAEADQIFLDVTDAGAAQATGRGHVAAESPAATGERGGA